MSATSRPVVVLVGPMGAGKSTVADILATDLAVTSRDTDRDVEEMAGMSVAEIFVDRDEDYFRGLEREAVRRALDEHTGVLSLGGGAVLDPQTQKRLADHRVVFLRVGLGEAVKRVGLGTSRPMLLGNVRARVKALLDERAPIYESVADLVVDTDNTSPQDVADQIRRAIDE